MNFVVCKHMNDSTKYLFALPDGVAIDAGTIVACNTARGADQPAVCLTSSFEADPDKICPLWGTTRARMRPVTKVLREFVLDWQNGLPFSDPNTEEADELPY